MFNNRVGNLSKLSSEEGLNNKVTNDTIPDFSLYQKNSNKTVKYFNTHSDLFKKTVNSFSKQVSSNVSDKTIEENTTSFPEISRNKISLNKKLKEKISFSKELNNISKEVLKKDTFKNDKIKLEFERSKNIGVSNFISFIHELKAFKSYNKSKKF